MSKEWFLQLIRQHFYDEMDNIRFNYHAEGCGLEDRNIQDRYEAMEHGWQRAIETVKESIENI
jgi:hypothetical protein